VWTTVHVRRRSCARMRRVVGRDDHAGKHAHEREAVGRARVVQWRPPSPVASTTPWDVVTRPWRRSQKATPVGVTCAGWIGAAADPPHPPARPAPTTAMTT
jgi:hypothetical protein